MKRQNKLKIEIVMDGREAQISCHTDKRLLLSAFRVTNGKWTTSRLYEAFHAGMTDADREWAVKDMEQAIQDAAEHESWAGAEGSISRMLEDWAGFIVQAA